MRNDSVTNAVDADAFRQTMSLFTTGVSVVSALNEVAEPRGFTANSLVSVSLDPMLICWSIQNTSSQVALYTNSLTFAVNILSAEQRDLATRYAAPGHGEQRAEDFVMSETGLPVIADALATLECRQWSLVPAGDHTMIFGEVTRVQTRQGVAPLAYYKGGFCGLSEEI